MMRCRYVAITEFSSVRRFDDRFSNPVFGILAGMVFTAIIQSSSASVGILQALATSGLIGLPSAVFVLFGQNIGTCITAVLASIGTSRSAKRTTIIHLLFNVIGTVIFTVVCIVTPLTALVQSFTPENPAAQIANMHTIFNVVTTLLLLPFGTYLAKAAERILPERSSEKSSEQQLMYIKNLEPSHEHQIRNLCNRRKQHMDGTGAYGRNGQVKR